MMEITVYGAEEKCPSCVQLPSAKETFEWLEAAVTRKFPNEPLKFRYVDINEPETASDKKFAEAILREEYFYPLVVIDEQVVGEGNPKLKDVYRAIEKKLG